jgi:hypothetical protein
MASKLVSKAIVVKYVKEVIGPKDIEKVWTYLGTKFGFNVPAWKKEFEGVLLLSRRDRSFEDQFMEFGKKQIEPILNDILLRRNYPTWINLLAFILKDKIEAQRNRDRYYDNRYS